MWKRSLGLCVSWDIRGFKVKWPVLFLLTGPCYRRSQPATFSGCYPMRDTLFGSPVPRPGACLQLRLKGAGKVGHMAGGSCSLYPRRRKSGRCLLMEAPCPTVLAQPPQLQKVCVHSTFPGRYGHTPGSRDRATQPVIQDGGHRVKGKKPWA